MGQLNFHSDSLPKKDPPPRRSFDLPILQKLVAVYKVWQESLRHFPKPSRDTLVIKIDNLFIDNVETIFIAQYTSKEQKISLLQKTIDKFKLIKFLLQISWEIKFLDNKKYINLSKNINEIEKSIWAWQKQIKNSALSGE